MEEHPPGQEPPTEGAEDLQDPKERFRQLFEDAPLGYQSLDADGRILMVNRAWLKLLGYGRGEVAGRSFCDILAPASAELFRRRFPAFKEEGETHGAEFDMVRKDGRAVRVSVEGRIARNPDGSFRQAQCLLTDITGRRRAEELKDLLATMVDASPVAITVHDYDGNFVYANERTLQMHGYARDELLGLNLRDLDVPKSAALIEGRMAEIREKGEALFEVRHRRKDGTTFPLLVQAKPLLWEGRQVILSLATDITERKRAEEVLRESEGKYRRLVETAQEGIWAIDGESRTTFVNPRMAEMLGYRVEEMLGRHLFSFMDGEGVEDARYYLERRQRMIKEEHDFRIIRKDGAVMRVRMATSPISDGDGRYLGALAVVSDMTERLRAEEALARRNTELRSLNALAMEMAALPPGQDLREILVKRLLQMTGAAAAWFSDYDRSDRSLSITHLEGEPELVRKATDILGMAPSEVRSPVDEATYRELVLGGVGKRLTLTEISFGAVPLDVGDSIQHELGVDRFFGLPYVIGGELFGTSLLAMGAGTPDPSMELLGAFGSLAAISIRRLRAEVELRSSELRFRSLVDNLADVVVEMDLDGKLTYVSAQSVTSYGFHPEDLLGKNVLDFIHQDSLAAGLEAFAKVSASVPQFDIECLVRHKGGGFVESSATGRLVGEGDGARIVGILKDISERKRAERALRESEERYRVLAENAADVIWTIDLGFNLTFCSPSIRRLLGYTPEEMRGFTIDRFLTPASLEHVLSAWEAEKVIDSSAPPDRSRTLEVEQIRKDGSPVWTEIAFSALRGGDGRPVGVLGVSRDISERKRAAESVALSEQRFRTLAEFSPEVLFETDAAGNFTFLSDIALEKWGYAGPAPGDSLNAFQILAPQDRQEAQERFAGILGGGKAGTMEAVTLKKDGTQVPVLIHAVPIEREGRVAGIRGVATDISDRKRAEQALRESEERFRGAFEQGPIGIALADVHQRLVSVNTMFSRIVGYGADELSRMTFRDFTHQDDLEASAEGIRRLRAGEIPVFDTEKRYLRKDGAVVWCRTVVSLLHNAARSPVRSLVLLEDITERKQAERALRESEEKYHGILDNLSDVVVELDGRGIFRFVSPQITEVFGFGPGEMMGRSFSDFIHPDWLHRARAGIQKVLEGGTVHDVEFWCLHKDGRYLDASLSARRVAREGEASFVAIIKDISERKRAEEALRASEEKYRDLVENVNDVIYSVDEKGLLTYVSPSAKRILGYGPEEVIGRPFSAIVHGDDIKRIMDEFVRRLDGVLEPAEYRLLDKAGRTRWVRTSSRMVKTGGRVIGLTGTVTDITDRKMAEEALRSSEEKFRGLFETSPEGVVLLDLEGTVIDINESALRLGGLPRGRVIGRPFGDLGSVPDDELPRYIELFRKLAAGEPFDPLEIRVSGQQGEQWMEVFPALLKKGDEVNAIQVIMRDITERKKARLEMMARLMKYELAEGNIYLVKESAQVRSLDAFRDLLRAGYAGVALSRMPRPEMPLDAALPFVHRWLSEKGGKDSIRPRLEDIQRWLEGLPRTQALLIDRLDYIISKNGATRTLHFVHGLREIAYVKGHIVILSLDPATVEPRWLRLLEKESMPVEPRSQPALTPELLDMLDYVLRQNTLGARLTLTELGKGLAMSKPTARKKVRDLVRLGCVTISLRGRTKVLELTERGRRIFSL